MAEIPKYMYVGRENESTNLRVNYDEILINSLVEEDSWIEVERVEDSGTTKHAIYNPVSGPIKFIEWNE